MIDCCSMVKAALLSALGSRRDRPSPNYKDLKMVDKPVVACTKGSWFHMVGG